jgi:hypothetical protein
MSNRNARSASAAGFLTLYVAGVAMFAGAMTLFG